MEFYVLSKFFTLFKEEDLKKFNEEKSKLSKVKTEFAEDINFILGFDENITKLINKDNFSVTYNLMIGIFSM